MKIEKKRKGTTITYWGNRSRRGPWRRRAGPPASRAPCLLLLLGLRPAGRLPGSLCLPLSGCRLHQLAVFWGLCACISECLYKVKQFLDGIYSFGQPACQSAYSLVPAFWSLLLRLLLTDWNLEAVVQLTNCLASRFNREHAYLNSADG
jgi:hypothetical protein